MDIMWKKDKEEKMTEQTPKNKGMSMIEIRMNLNELIYKKQSATTKEDSDFLDNQIQKAQWYPESVLKDQQKQHEAEIKEIQKELELLRISKVHQKCPHCNKIVTLKLKRD